MMARARAIVFFLVIISTPRPLVDSSLPAQRRRPPRLVYLECLATISSALGHFFRSFALAVILALFAINMNKRNDQTQFVFKTASRSKSQSCGVCVTQWEHIPQPLLSRPIVDAIHQKVRRAPIREMMTTMTMTTTNHVPQFLC